jgi:hypothetical protein
MYWLHVPDARRRSSRRAAHYLLGWTTWKRTHRYTPSPKIPYLWFGLFFSLRHFLIHFASQICWNWQAQAKMWINVYSVALELLFSPLRTLKDEKNKRVYLQMESNDWQKKANGFEVLQNKLFSLLCQNASIQVWDHCYQFDGKYTERWGE